MQPNSLIFLVIVGIWAAFVVQLWVRRREHMLTAQNLDQLSSAMRVLDRPAAASTPLAPSPASAPIFASRAAMSSPTQTVQPPRVGRLSSAGVPSPAPLAHSAAPAARSARRLSAAPRTRAPRPPRAVRGVALLASLAATLVLLPLAAFGVLGWMAPLVALVALAGSFAWLRSCVQAELALGRQRSRGTAPRRQSARQGLAPRVASTGRRVPSAGEGTGGPAARGETPEPSSSPTEAAVVEADGTHAPGSESIADPVGLATEEFVAVEVVAAEQSAGGAPVPDSAMTPLVDEDDIPLTWNPVPVPRPTYTMKAKAPDVIPVPAGEPAENSASDADRDSTAYEPSRRVVGQ